MVSHNNRCGAKTNKGTRCKKAINHQNTLDKDLVNMNFCKHHQKSLIIADFGATWILTELYSEICPATPKGEFLHKLMPHLVDALRFYNLSARSYHPVNPKNFTASFGTNLKEKPN